MLASKSAPFARVIAIAAGLAALTAGAALACDCDGYRGDYYRDDYRDGYRYDGHRYDERYRHYDRGDRGRDYRW